MLSPIELATWISLCIPAADPAVVQALALAGSGGEPYTITAPGSPPQVATTFDAALALARQPDATHERHVGLTQIPAATLKEVGIPPEAAMTPCVNLEVGWQIWSAAYEKAQQQEKTPMKALSLAFAWFHDRRWTLETPYSQKAMQLKLNYRPVAPAAADSRLYAEINAAAANARAMLLRLESPGTQLGDSNALASWSRLRAN